MVSKKSFLILAIGLSFACNTSLAFMCARLKSVSAGENHTLALMDNGTLWACGSNSDKQLGLGSGVPYVYSLKQVKGENGVGFLKNIVTYDAGWVHSLASDSNGTVWAWGTDDYGQLGNGPGREDRPVPAEVNGVGGVGNLSNIVYVSAGRSGKHSLAVDSNGYVYAWGLNISGQCGDGNTGGQKDYPVLVLDSNLQTTGRYLGDEAHIIAVDAGVDHSIALDDVNDGGHVWHWGSYSSTGTYPEKVKASPDFGGQELSNITQIASCSHSVAVDRNGNVWEWYYSDSAYKVPGGQMGTDYLEGIVEVSAGSGYSMARTSDGQVLVWSNGENAYPEYVEDGEMETPSGLLEGIISIAMGFNNHRLAVCKRGHGWAWGSDNDYGQFGVGDSNSRPEPAQMLCAEVPGCIYLAKTLEVEGNEPNCFSFDDYITYRITYGPNSYDHNNVVITDYLPDEVEYDSSDPCGTYNPYYHTVIWQFGHLDANTPNDFVTLTVKVDKCAESDGIITNYCQIENDIGYSDAEYAAYLCSASNPNPACGEIIVDLGVGEFNLTWCPGRFAADVNGHEVYFGSNFNVFGDFLQI